MASIDDIAAELYGLPLAEFTATRDRHAKSADDIATARQVKALRKPSAAAWAVNVLLRDRRTQLEEVLTLGASLRTAQRDLDSRSLRELTQQRRQLVAALARQASEVARGLGQPINAAAVGDVEQTLQAALADAAAADAVRTGTLVRALQTVGLDPVDLTDAVAVGGATAAGATVDADRAAARERDRASAREAAEEAERHATETAEDLDDLTRQTAESSRARMKLVARVEQLESRLTEARAELEEVETAGKSVERRREKAEKRADAARREADRLQARLEQLS